MTLNLIGVDLGGTTIKAAIVNEDGVILLTSYKPTPQAAGGAAILDAVAEVVQDLQNKAQSAVTAIGVGTTGRVQQETGKIVHSGDTIPDWTGTEVRDILERKLSMPIYVDNDVNVAALGEGWLGAAKHLEHYAYVTIGTGLGGALVHRGEVIAGHRGGTGEFGHMILYPNGIECGCGQRGCAEKYVSGTALGEAARRLNPAWNSYDLMNAFAEQDQRAVAILHRFVHDLSMVLINVQNMFDPKKIIMGGGFMKTYPLWSLLLHQRLNENAKIMVDALPSSIGNDAGILGAARLALNAVKNSFNS